MNTTTTWQIMWMTQIEAIYHVSYGLRSTTNKGPRPKNYYIYFDQPVHEHLPSNVFYISIIRPYCMLVITNCANSYLCAALDFFNTLANVHYRASSASGSSHASTGYHHISEAYSSYVCVPAQIKFLVLL